MPGNARIVRLGEDMISLGSEISEINAPYHFEANELNYINGTYVYTYNTSWAMRIIWENDGLPAPSACSMCYMTTKTPLDTDSWVYHGEYFQNPGRFGMGDSNNHTHLQKFKDRYFLLYHSLMLQNSKGISGGYRSLCVNDAEVDENTVTISTVTASSDGAVKID
jgi:hypothetical protein